MPRFARPTKPVCALCGVDDDVETVHLGDGVWQHICRGRHHDESRVWNESTAQGVDALQLDGLAYEWGLYDDLPRCVVADEPMVEYGIVEHRYRLLNPVRYGALTRTPSSVPGTTRRRRSSPAR